MWQILFPFHPCQHREVKNGLKQIGLDDTVSQCHLGANNVAFYSIVLSQDEFNKLIHQLEVNSYELSVKSVSFDGVNYTLVTVKFWPRPSAKTG